MNNKPWLKWLKRILLGAGGLLLLLIALLGGSIILDTTTAPSSQEWANTTFSGPDGIELHGYLAAPEGEGPFPTVLLIHEWWGFNEGMTVLADALASEGYLVLAADAYRGRVTDKVPRALWMRLTTPEEKVHADLDAALDFLLAHQDADPDRAATMGFCFGGGHSLQLGLRQSERLAVTVMYYGAVVTDPALLRPLTDGQPVLGVFGEEDQQIFVDEVIEFEAALNSLDIPNQITIYPGVGHAFLNEDNYTETGSAAAQAWDETLLFLDENLKNPAP